MSDPQLQSFVDAVYARFQELDKVPADPVGSDGQVWTADGTAAAWEELPVASASQRGVVSTSNQEFAGRKSASNSKVRAYLSTDATAAGGVYTVIPFNAEIFDTNNELDTTSNKGRFTATKSGYFFVHASVFTASTMQVGSQITLFKNGVRVAIANGFKDGTETGRMQSLTEFVFMNGTTDYIDIRYYPGGSNQTMSSNAGDVGATRLMIAEML